MKARHSHLVCDKHEHIQNQYQVKEHVWIYPFY
jgi:hypothetical protein